jgi:uncharacterized membrane protein
MSDTQLFAVFLIILASFGIYLHSQGKLLPILTEITTPSTTGKSTISLTSWLVAFVTYIFILSFMDTKSGLILTGLIVTGALLVNQKTMGKDSLLNLLLSKTQGGTSK